MCIAGGNVTYFFRESLGRSLASLCLFPDFLSILSFKTLFYLCLFLSNRPLSLTSPEPLSLNNGYLSGVRSESLFPPRTSLLISLPLSPSLLLSPLYLSIYLYLSFFYISLSLSLSPRETTLLSPHFRSLYISLHY